MRLLYTVAEVADMLAVSRQKVYDLFNAGELESVKVGGSRRIPHQALEAFVESLRP